MKSVDRKSPGEANYEAPSVEAIMEGRPEALREVHRWIQSALAPYRFALQSDLQDLEQEVMVILFSSLSAGSFRGESPLGGYVRSLTHNRCVDRIRFLSRRPLGDLSEVDRKSVLADRQARQDQEHRDVMSKVVKEMPEECLSLWKMLYLGLRYDEMSAQTGIAPGTLRARVLRCRKRATALRHELLNSKGDEP